MKSEIVVIGGGASGLMAAYHAARTLVDAGSAAQVTVLEKNATIGGGLQSFRRFGCLFDTGMHVVSGMQPGGNIWRICRYLGILDKVRLRDVDDDCTDHLYFAEDHQDYRIAKGRDGFVRSLASYFPEEEANLRRYVDDVYGLTDEVDMLHLRPTRTDMVAHSEMFLMAADDFIARHADNPRLRSVLAYMNPLYGGRGQQTPAYVHAIVSRLYIDGASRFVGGSSHFADALADVIRQHGGSVVAGDGVEWIEVNDRRVDYVRTRKGLRYEADYYISDIHPCQLMTLMDKQAFPKAYRDRLNEIPNAYSAFSLYIKIKPGRFPYINHSEYYMTRYDDIWNFGREDRPWPLGFLLMTPPEEQQGEWSEKVLLTAPMNFEKVRRWEHTTVGHRGEDYEKWKEERTQELLALVEQMHPGFTEAIEAVNSSSPLTIRDFYGSKEGTLAGFSKDCRNIMRSQVPVVTKVRNLLLTGQNNNLHGFCGVPLTAINTCEALLGLNYIIEKLRN